MKPKYTDFVLTVDGSPARYTVEARAPGETQISPQPFLYHETAELIEQLEEMQEGFSSSSETMEAVGTLLYDALFPRPISRLWERSRLGLPSDTTLRLSLNIRPPELSYLPWELLYDSEDEIFLATRLSYPIVRYIESGTPVASALASHPVRLLYLQSNPYDTAPLDLTASLEALQAAWGQDCEITVVKNTTPSALRDALRRDPGFDILHYDGHAEFDESTEEGYLVLHDADESSYRLAGSTLADYLDASSIRLVVLAACETAINSTQQRFAGIAHQLMRASSLPAVVAMQFAIADSMAIAFNREFYKALADDYPIEAAIIQGRQAILEEIGEESEASLDWATPVLFMRPQNEPILQIETMEQKEMTTTNAQKSDIQHQFNISGPVNGMSNFGGTQTFESSVTVDMGTGEPAGKPSAKQKLTQLLWQLTQLWDSSLFGTHKQKQLDSHSGLVDSRSRLVDSRSRLVTGNW
jgi:CHAT domain-containing protein